MFTNDWAVFDTTDCDINRYSVLIMTIKIYVLEKVLETVLSHLKFT